MVESKHDRGARGRCVPGRGGGFLLAPDSRGVTLNVESRVLAFHARRNKAQLTETPRWGAELTEDAQPGEGGSGGGGVQS